MSTVSTSGSMLDCAPGPPAFGRRRGKALSKVRAHKYARPHMILSLPRGTGGPNGLPAVSPRPKAGFPALGYRDYRPCPREEGHGGDPALSVGGAAHSARNRRYYRRSRRRPGVSYFPSLFNCISDRQRQQFALRILDRRQRLSCRQTNDQAILQLPIRPFSWRPQEYGHASFVGKVELVPESCHFVCLTIVIFSDTRQQKSPVPSRRTGLRSGSRCALAGASRSGTRAELQCVTEPCDAAAGSPVVADGHRQLRSRIQPICGHVLDQIHSLLASFPCRPRAPCARAKNTGPRRKAEPQEGGRKTFGAFRQPTWRNVFRSGAATASRSYPNEYPTECCPGWQTTCPCHGRGGPVRGMCICAVR